MTGFGKNIITVGLLSGVATVAAGCAYPGTASAMRGHSTSKSRSTATLPVIVPENYGVVEEHVVEVNPGARQGIYATKIYSLASIDAREKSANVKSVSRLTEYNGAYEADCPDVSPDGNTIVYQLRGEDGSINLWTVAAKSGVKAVAKTHDKSLNFAPTFASDGARIIFSSNRQSSSGNIWGLGASGEMRRVTDTNESDMWAHEDPIGQSTVALTRFHPGDSRGEIWVYDHKSYTAAQLREGRQPRVSPDGAMIAFSAFDPQDGHWNIWVMKIDGSQPTQLTDNDADNITPSWHADGHWIIYASNNGAATAMLREADAEIKLHNFDIWMTDVSGKRAIQLTVNGSDDRHPVFAPDGKSFYFSSNRGQAVDVTPQELQAYRGRRRTVVVAGAEFPIASGRDIWRAELSNALVSALADPRSLQASAQ